MSANEVIHESETGGKKAGNLERYDLLPPAELREIAVFYATAYANDWIGGSFNELSKQLWLFWEGDDIDPETDYPRLVHVAYHALELLSVWANDADSQLEEVEDIWTRYDHIPAEPLRLLAQHYGRGALKYDDDNWQKGYDWRLSFAALNRHLWQHQAGQFLDEETGSPHLVAVAWHAITLLWFYDNKPEFDTRRSTKIQRELDAANPFRNVEESDPFTPDHDVYYISGPMSGIEDNNHPAFNAAAAHYRAKGITVLNPAEFPGEGAGNDHPWEWYLKRDLVELVKATHIVLLPGWHESKGAQLELDVAKRLGLKVLHHWSKPWGLDLDKEQDPVRRTLEIAGSLAKTFDGLVENTWTLPDYSWTPNPRTWKTFTDIPVGVVVRDNEGDLWRKPAPTRLEMKPRSGSWWSPTSFRASISPSMSSAFGPFVELPNYNEGTK